MQKTILSESYSLDSHVQSLEIHKIKAGIGFRFCGLPDI